MYIRYNTTTLQEVYRSTAPYTTPPGAGFTDAEVPDASVNGPVGQCRINASLTAVAADPALAPPTSPDWVGFLKWMPTAFDAPTLNAFAKAYPTMLGFCQFGNTLGAQWCIMDAKVNLPLTSAQYTLFQGANITYHLGMTLP